MGLEELLEKIIKETGYLKELKAENTEEAKARIENIDELMSKVANYEKSSEQSTLSGFLQEVSLVSDIDSVEDGNDYVLMMTLHSAKGLEFDNVYMVGMEDGIFPSYLTISGENSSELEEERSLCYVGITRARKTLTMTSAMQRMIRSEIQYNKTSRFVMEIPRELVDWGWYTISARHSFDPSIFGGMKLSRRAYSAETFKPRKFTVNKSKSLEYDIGDTVCHIKFGIGKVQDITEGGKDYEVTVDFEQMGVKRMFASFAKLKKL